MFTSEANGYLNYESGRLKYWISEDKIAGVKVKQYDITKVIIGDITNIREETNFGRVTNQIQMSIFHSPKYMDN